MSNETGSLWRLHPLRVRYQETDRMGVVYHGNYVNWFEIGRTEFIRTAGMPYRSVEAAGLLLPVTELDCSFRLPAIYDDAIVLCTRVVSFTALRIAFASEIRRVSESELQASAAGRPTSSDKLPGELLVSGGTRHVWVNGQWKPVRIDRVLPELYMLLDRLMKEEGKKGGKPE